VQNVYGKQGEEILLRAAYTNALKLAARNKCGSVAFPLISDLSLNKRQYASPRVL
jgi:O-acetyl-ADP-ribose deacetylase (regulator of RNase III)